MCDGSRYIDQFTSMASLDYAAIGENLTREIMFMAFESPEMFNTIKDIAAAGQCAAKVVKDAIPEGEDGEEETGDGDDEFVFATDDGEVDVAETAGEAAECFAAVDKYSMGVIAGKIFVRFFDTAEL